jgi:hypothetical protein
MKHFGLMCVFFLLLLCSIANAFQEGLKEESLKPLKFPKFSVFMDYGLKRKFKAFADPSLKIALRNRLDIGLSFEAGLLKYLNAGALFFGSLSKVNQNEPIDISFGLFAKPQLSIGDRIGIFGRFSAGFTTVLPVIPALAYYRDLDETIDFSKSYKDQSYDGWPFGGFGSASIGMEFFPFSRIGLALECGIRAIILRSNKSVPGLRPPPNVAGAPNSFNYMTYEIPFALTIHAIL